MPFFKPIISPWITIIFTLIFAILTILSFKRQRVELSQRLRIALLLLRIFAVLLLAFWLLQPYHRSREPKAGASQLAILLDASPSMSARRDCDSSLNNPNTTCTRLQAGINALQNLPETLLTSTWRFCDNELYPFDERTQNASLSGNTDIGSALKALLQDSSRDGALPLQGVVLISDGRQWGDAIGAARLFSSKGIPISTLCLGSSQKLPDISIAFGDETPSTVPIHEQAEAVLKVKNDFKENKNVKVTLFNATGATIASQEVNIPAENQHVITMPFPVSDTVGEALFSAAIDAPQDDGDPANDHAEHILTYQKPPELRVLFMASNPNWEWRFLRNALSDTDNLTLSALIRLGLSDVENEKLPNEWKPNLRFYKLNCECADAFPTTSEFYKDYDAVVMPCESANELTAPEQNALRNFVEHQGGGLLWLGDASLLPENMKNLIPGDAFENKTSGLSGKAILAAEDFLFKDILVQPMPFVIGSKYTVCRNPRKIARTVLRDERGGAILLAEGNYGAGRVAWSGIGESWRWALNGSGAFHADFWKQLVIWLSANRQPQMELDIPEEGIIANRENEIAIRILGPDFRPAQAANVRLTINEQEITVTPDMHESGRHIGVFTPSEAGAVHIHFQAKCTQETDFMTLDKYLLVNNSGQELSELTPDETLMRDIARITGGKILSMPIDWNNLPQSNNIPQSITEKTILPDWAALLPAALLLLIEYAIRRRNAQK